MSQSDAEPPPAPADLTPAALEEVTEALAYALRHDERGRPRRGAVAGWDFAAGIAAEHLAGHLARAGFVVMKRRPGRPHRAG
ncbi:hypothetical protein [Siccirubricoccus sp. G192]|uniref:hypothetical protein n=1 Tax=Siccirubricoccus sp. G192 TaxID=2849651 RepID=UPI001C2BB202|nr:hypothetical protein [Siccirubricoccus sp. G192]MBV1800434.1 hypothetical protein [Siccirubricoccus sp. G192]